MKKLYWVSNYNRAPDKNDLMTLIDRCNMSEDRPYKSKTLSWRYATPLTLWETVWAELRYIWWMHTN